MTKRACNENERRERECVEKAVGKKCKGISNGQMNCMYREEREIISGRFDSLGREKKRIHVLIEVIECYERASISFMMYSSMRFFFIPFLAKPNTFIHLRIDLVYFFHCYAFFCPVLYTDTVYIKIF